MSLTTLSLTNDETWLLTGQLGADQAARSVTVANSPFVIGRCTSASLTIASPTVSTSHAELRLENGELWVRDLGSTNGTFVNGVRVAIDAAVPPAICCRLPGSFSASAFNGATSTARRLPATRPIRRWLSFSLTS